jgi:CRP/FNR family transcriptional regulator
MAWLIVSDEYFCPAHPSREIALRHAPAKGAAYSSQPRNGINDQVVYLVVYNLCGYLIRGLIMLEMTENQGLSPIKTVSNNQSVEAATGYKPSCTGCIAKEISACAGFVGSRFSGRDSALASEVPSTGQLYPSRRPIVHHREVSEFVPIICTGWAMSALLAQDGKRQIVSFALGGDVAAANYIFEPCSGRTVEAISEVYCRKFKRSEFQAALQNHEAGKAALAKLLVKDRAASDQLRLDLGRSAETRIARLIVNLSARLKAKGVADDNFEFPLRQQHIADATGLTTVHVCKILSRMRIAGVLNTSGRRMRILDRKALQEIADQ